jgi:hypothetical protein
MVSDASLKEVKMIDLHVHNSKIPGMVFPSLSPSLFLCPGNNFNSILARLYPIGRQKTKGRVSFSQNSYQGKRRDVDSAKKDYTRVAPV